MKTKYKILILIAIVIGLSIYYGSIVHTENQKIVVCITSSQQCDVFTLKQVQPDAADGGNCINHPSLGKICRPDFIVLPLNVLVPALKKTCIENGHGVFSGWNTCTRTQGTYLFNPVDQTWRRVAN